MWPAQGEGEEGEGGQRLITQGGPRGHQRVPPRHPVIKGRLVGGMTSSESNVMAWSDSIWKGRGTDEGVGLFLAPTFFFVLPTADWVRLMMTE